MVFSSAPLLLSCSFTRTLPSPSSPSVTTSARRSTSSSYSTVRKVYANRLCYFSSLPETSADSKMCKRVSFEFRTLSGKVTFSSMHRRLDIASDYLDTSWSGSSSSCWLIRLTVRPEEVTVTRGTTWSREKKRLLTMGMGRTSEWALFRNVHGFSFSRWAES